MINYQARDKAHVQRIRKELYSDPEMLDFQDTMNSDLFAKKYGLAVPASDSYVFQKLPGSDGPFRSGINSS